MRSFRHQRQSGFTLIELIIVIVIIGILAAVAIPKFATLSDDATRGAMKGIGGSIASASATNYAACKGGLIAPTCVTGINACTNLSVGTLLSDVAVLSGYTISGGAIANTGVATTCTITSDIDTTLTATFQAYGS